LVSPTLAPPKKGAGWVAQGAWGGGDERSPIGQSPDEVMRAKRARSHGWAQRVRGKPLPTTPGLYIPYPLLRAATLAILLRYGLRITPASVMMAVT
jgi:hypothetical protein